MKITVLHTPKSKFGPYTLVYGLSAWPLGTRRNRGWENAPVVYERDATSAEVEEARSCPRFVSYRYKAWSGLVADEARFGIDAEALAPARYKPGPSESDMSVSDDQGGGWSIEREITDIGFLGRYLVRVDGEEVGRIEPYYAGRESSRVVGYRTHVMLEFDALSDETGFPNHYPRLADARVAVAELMTRNGIVPAAGTMTRRAA